MVVEKERCRRCKTNTMIPVTSFGRGAVKGFRCKKCGARKAVADGDAPKGTWPKAQAWLAKQRLKK